MVGMRSPIGKRNNLLPLPVRQSLFVRNLLKLLEENGVTAEQLAQETGLDRILLRRLLRGEVRPSRSVLQQLSTAASVGASYKTLVTWCMLDDCLKYSGS